MKRLYSLLLVAGLLLAFTPDIRAQVTLNTTTLSTAITTPSPAQTNGTTAVTVASLGSGATAIAAGNLLVIDGETMLVRVVPTSGTTLTVQRAYNGSIAQTHAANSLIFYGLPQYFVRGTPGLQIYQGTCTAAYFSAMPIVDNVNSMLWNCADGRWGALRIASPSTALQVYHPVANVNYTALITDDVIGFTSLTATRTVTLPSAVGIAGKTILIRDESGNAGTNTASIAVSPNVNSGNKSASILTGFGSITLKSNGTGWFQQ
jgi:hypothetical protein